MVAVGYGHPSTHQSAAPNNPPVAPYNPLNDPTGQYAGVNNNGPVFSSRVVLLAASTRGRLQFPSGSRSSFLCSINCTFQSIQTAAFSPFPPCSTLTLACAIQACLAPQVEDMAVQTDEI